MSWIMRGQVYCSYAVRVFNGNLLLGVYPSVLYGPRMGNVLPGFTEVV